MLRNGGAHAAVAPQVADGAALSLSSGDHNGTRYHTAFTRSMVSEGGRKRMGAAQKMQAVARGNSTRHALKEAQRYQQVKEVYGSAEPPKTEIARLRARVEELEKENRVLKLRLAPPDKEAAQKAGSAAKWWR